LDFDDNMKMAIATAILAGMQTPSVSVTPTVSTTIAPPTVARTSNSAISSRFTANAARREAMRKAGIPTSQQPVSQGGNAGGKFYNYEVKAVGGGTRKMSVQQKTNDKGHGPHFEAGPVKVDPFNGAIRLDRYGTPKLFNSKSKVYYGPK
jgi:hypothetical protein